VTGTGGIFGRPNQGLPHVRYSAHSGSPGALSLGQRSTMPSSFGKLRRTAVVVTTAHPDEVGNLEHVLGVMPKPFVTEAVQEVLHYAARKLKGGDAGPITVT